MGGTWGPAPDNNSVDLPAYGDKKAEHIFDEKGNIVLDNPRTIETYKFYKKLFDMSPPASASW